jgi:hypothetical protein
MKKNRALETAFHCDTCWHLPGLAFRIYELACKVGYRNKNKFWAILKNLAVYFNVSESTIKRELKILKELGFFEVLDEGPFIPTVYRVLSHKEYAEKHPGQCCQKEALPWTDDPLVDPLAQQFYAISGGKIKFRTNDMKGLRKLGFTDEELLREFRNFFDQKWPGGYTGKRYSTMFSGRFVRHLKDQLGKLPTHELRGRAKALREAKEEQEAATNNLAGELYAIGGPAFSGKALRGLKELQTSFSDEEITRAWDQFIRDEGDSFEFLWPMKFADGGGRIICKALREREAEKAHANAV